MIVHKFLKVVKNLNNLDRLAYNNFYCLKENILLLSGINIFYKYIRIELILRLLLRYMLW